MFVTEPIIDLILRATILTGIAIFWVVLLVRVNGLRSFSEMTNFDFVMTVAIGSLLAGASQSTNWTSFMQTLLSIGMLFAVQYTTATLRKKFSKFESVMQNKPVLLMQDGIILQHALKTTRVAQSDVIAKLREANVLDLSKVRAVVLETTGDICVLHGDSCSDKLLEGVELIKG